MKKILTVLLTLALVFTMAGVVSAEEYTNNEPTEQSVPYDSQLIFNETGSSYVVSIPAKFVMEKVLETDGNDKLVAQDNVSIEAEFQHSGICLSVSMTSTTYKINNVLYSIYRDDVAILDGENVQDEDKDVMTYYYVMKKGYHSDYEGGKTAQLRFEMPYTDAVRSSMTAGESYTDTITFCVFMGTESSHYTWESIMAKVGGE